MDWQTSDQRGAKWPFAPRCVGEGLEGGDLRRVEKERSASVAVVVVVVVVVVLRVLHAGRKERSQTLRSARPCATLARRATVQGVDASKSLSRVAMVSGRL